MSSKVRRLWMSAFWIAIALVSAVVIGLFLFVRSHRRWLLVQSPVGVWVTSQDSRQITLSFEGGSNEGTYKQLSEFQGVAEREFGSWSSSLSRLGMLILATDQKDHPRFGVDSTYTIRYVGPHRIAIDGPDRPGLIFRRAPASTLLDIGPADASDNSLA